MEIIWLAITGAAGITGYVQSRRFVRDRLRFVEAVQKPFVPIIVGVAAAVVAAPVVWLLPIVNAASATILGVGVGVGVHHGVKDTRKLPGY